MSRSWLQVRREAGEAYSFVACLSHVTIDHASLSRQSTVPTPNRDTSRIRACITFFYITFKTFCLPYALTILSFVATIYLIGQ